MDCWHREIDRASTEDEVVARPKAEQFQELSSYFWHAAARIREIRRTV